MAGTHLTPVGHSPAADALDAMLQAHRSDANRLPAPAVSRFTREEIVAAIRRWHDLHGEPPKVVDLGTAARRALARSTLRSRNVADRRHRQAAIRKHE